MDGNGTVLSYQRYTPWGEVRDGTHTVTSIDVTGQRRDDSGLLFYNARSYDPKLARFLSADTVPGNASGGMDGVAYRPLTVAFHAAGFAERLNAEDSMGLPFQQDSRTRQQAGSPWGPVQPQSLNRYSYVLNNPEKWTDPTGHDVRYLDTPFGTVFSGGSVVNDSSHAVYVTGERPLYNADGPYRRDAHGRIMVEPVTVRMQPYTTSADDGLVDADCIEPATDSIDG